MERMMEGIAYPEGKELNEQIFNHYNVTSKNNRAARTAFCYILIDPSLINNPNTALLKEFVNAIFYIGKGKRNRPMQHLIEAVKATENSYKKNAKIQKIRKLWDCGYGVVSLHVFQNITSKEAFTREAAMIDAIGISNLTNEKRGQYYDIGEKWLLRQKLIYGSYLLSRALEVLHVEGCRQLFESNVEHVITNYAFRL
ncbi:unnamed protein product [Dracunculus medinensis]|uniref:GIY-YIG domain-containing protein n=1 Tax=Dracunculus medinensis TaxID=318479 RepID=A0A3P7QA08_DRAME|nr:unnamed protein product [Dracunculus medinensis]